MRFGAKPGRPGRGRANGSVLGAGGAPPVAGHARRSGRRMRRPAGAVYPLLAFALLAPPTAAQTGAGQLPPAQDLTDRVEALEQRLGTSALFDLIARIERLAKEIQQLRDRIEVQGRGLEDLRKRQQDLYAELDRLSLRAPVAAREDVAGAAPATASSPRPGTEPDPGSSPIREGSVAEGRAGPAAENPGGEASSAPAPGGRDTLRPDPVEEQSRYQVAFDLISEGHFERAADAFAQFRADFPDSRYGDDAWFWQGECLYALRRFEPALREFRALIENHPDSPRVPGAQLKIGFILDELGRSEEAAEVLEALVQAVPGSSDAKLARDRLERLR